MKSDPWTRRRRVLFGAVGAVVAAAVAIDAQQSPQRPVFRTDVNVITVDAYPLVDGRVVEGLTAGDFDLREDGRLQKIQAFEFVRADERMTNDQRRDPQSQQEMLDQVLDPRARMFVAYLDVHNVGIPGAYFGRQPIVELFHRILAPNDLIALTTSRNHPRQMTFGRTTSVVEQQLKRHWTWQDPDVTMNDAEELAIKHCVPMDQALGELLIARRRQDQLLSSLEGTIEYLGEVREGRKTMFLFSHGWKWFEQDTELLKILNNPERIPSKGPELVRHPGRDPKLGTAMWEGGRSACETEIVRIANFNHPPRFQRLIRDAALNNVAIYPVDVSGLTTGQSPPEGPLRDRLHELASDTGGTAVTERNDLVQGIIDVSREFSAYYLLGYVSDNPRTDGTLRKIDVSVRRPGVHVKARRGYRALSRAEAAAKSSVAVPVSIDAAAADVAAALDGLARTRATDDVFVRPVRSDRALTVVVDLAGARFGHAWSGDIAVVRRDTGERLTASVRIPANGRAATVDVALADIGDGVRASVRLTNAAGAVIEGAGQTDAAMPGPLGDVRLYRSRGSAALPAADLRFGRSERLRLEWPLTGALTSQQLRVLDRTGAPVAASASVTTPPGEARLIGEITLATLAPGDYLAELSVGVEGSAIRRLVAFRVV